jgi:hypothetical protein
MRDVLDHEFTGDRDYFRSFADADGVVSISTIRF